MYLSSLLLIGFLLRVHNFSGNFVWQDEVTTVWQVFLGFYEFTGDAPLYPSILRFLSEWTGWSTIDALRFWTLSIASLLPIAGYYYGKEVGGAKCGYLTGLIMLLHPSGLMFSQQIRPYALFMLVSCLFYLFSLRYLRLGRLFPLLVITSLCALTHLLTAQLCLGLVIALLLDRLWSERQETPHLTFLRFSKNIILICLVAIVSVYWLNGRLDHIVEKGAIQGVYREGLSGYLNYLFVYLPLGAGRIFPQIVLWIAFGFGLYKLIVSKNHRYIAIFCLCVLFTILATNYFTYGKRGSWGISSSRYFVHAMVLMVPFIAQGLIFTFYKITLFFNLQLRLPRIIGLVILSCFLLYCSKGAVYRNLSPQRDSNRERKIIEKLISVGVSKFAFNEIGGFFQYPRRETSVYLVASRGTPIKIFAIKKDGLLRYTSVSSPPRHAFNFRLTKKSQDLESGIYAVKYGKCQDLLRQSAGFKVERVMEEYKRMQFIFCRVDRKMPK